jgi:hypothetical protein
MIINNLDDDDCSGKDGVQTDIRQKILHAHHLMNIGYCIDFDFGLIIKRLQVKTG